MPAFTFAGGGSLDGAQRFIPDGVQAAVTTWRGSSSYYVLDDAGTEFGFAGFGEEGRAMAGIIRRFREAPGEAQREQAAIDDALRPQGCASCGGTFADAAAFAIHRDASWPGGCLPPGALGQLVSVDGVWVEAWRASR